MYLHLAIYGVSVFITSVYSEYLGCYNDDGNRKLRGAYTTFSQMTPQICIDYCKHKSYPYAGLQFWTNCFCGDETPTVFDKRPESDCNADCPGDGTSKCGGTWRNSVYKTGAVTLKHEYLGCYLDEGNRKLKGNERSFSSMTPRICIDHCRDLGYKYAGLQYRVQCFCGNEVPYSGDRRSEGDCDLSCPGDFNRKCGGTWRNSIYKTAPVNGTTNTSDVPVVATTEPVVPAGYSVVVQSREYEYLGCYVDDGNRKLRGEYVTFSMMTPKMCIDFCKSKSYAFAGLQYWTYCFCGDQTPLVFERRPESDCNADCPGDKSNKCGGTWRNSIFKTGEVPLQHEYLGCYLDDANRKLKGGHKVFGSLTQRICTDYCKERGFIYAGLQYRTYCFCGNETPDACDRKSEGDCDMNCPGDFTMKCGGTWRNSIFKTGEVPLQHEYLGCYLDDGNRKLKGAHKEFGSLTQRICTDYCKERGFIYAGLQYRTSCFCGNETPDASDRKSEGDCDMNCPGDFTMKCGGTWRNSIYKTEPVNKNEDPNANTKKKACVKSTTTVNRQNTCSNDVVFEESFDSLSPEKWSHVIEIPYSPDYQFVIYNSHPANSYVSDGKLVIKPTMLPDNQVRNGDLRLEGCTGKLLTPECGYKAASFMILPPVQTARLTTRNSFTFRYGKVEITAKLPLGDWLVPELWLEPRSEVYGSGYPSGKIRIAMSRGNKDLKLNGQDIGCKLLESCVLMGIGDNVRTRTVTREFEDGWYNDFHNYTVVWTPDNIIFSIDGEQPISLVPTGGGTLSDVMGFSPEVSSTWSSASKIAPFDNDFYITLGLSAGGIRDFPDSSINNGTLKPWRNLQTKALLNFWKDRNSWKATWQEDLSLLQIDYIKVTAL